MNQLNNIYVERALIKDRQSDLLQARRFQGPEFSPGSRPLRAALGAVLIRTGEYIRGRSEDLVTTGSEDAREAALHIAA